MAHALVRVGFRLPINQSLQRGFTASAIARGGPPPPALARVPPPWERVETEDGFYFWNTDTDETTAIGEAKPSGGSVAAQEQQQSQLAEPMQPGGGGMMGMMAQGMAFGVGSSVAHNVIGSAASALGGGDSGDAGAGAAGSAPADSGAADAGAGEADGGDGGGADWMAEENFWGDQPDDGGGDAAW